MTKKSFALVILMTIFLTACARPEAPAETDPQPTTVPTDVPATVAPSPSPEPAEAQSERDAAITAVANQAQARTTASDEYVAAQEGMILLVGGGVQTFEDSRASLNLRPDGTIIRVGPNTIFTVHEMTAGEQPTTRIKLDFGQIWILLSGGSLEVETPSGVASVRGSLLGVSYDPELKYMGASCLEGYCSLKNELGVVELTDGYKSAIEGELGPRFAEHMDDLELQQWINENPDAWRYFDREEIPDWLPKSDRNWLDDDSDYFNRIYDGEDSLFFDRDGFDGPLDGDGYDGPYDGDGFDGSNSGDGFDGPLDGDGFDGPLGRGGIDGTLDGDGFYRPLDGGGNGDSIGGSGPFH